MTVVSLSSGRMTEDEYETERAKLPRDKKQASARFEQALALLFYRSGWTQEALAIKEGKSQRWVSYRLLFGRFLNFSTTVLNAENTPYNLTERKFRSYWEQQTDKEQNERARFAEVVRAMQNNTAIRQPRRPNIRTDILNRYADGEWHDPQTIATELNADVGHIREKLKRIQADGNVPWGKCEDKQVGTEFHYRIFRSEKQVSLAELTQKLRPIIQKLKVEGKKNMATMSPMQVAILAGADRGS